MTKTSLAAIFFRLFFLVYKIHALNPLNIMEHDFRHHATSVSLKRTLLELHGPENGPRNGPLEADFRVKKEYPGSLNPIWSNLIIFIARSLDNG